MFGTRFPEIAFTRSQKATRLGINNSIPLALQANAQRLSNWLEDLELRVQEKLPGVRFRISSGYRCAELNKEVRGSNISYHKLALAADIEDDRGIVGPETLAKVIRDVSDDFDKIILEFGSWVHVQIAQEGVAPRHECLTARSEPVPGGKPKVVYLSGFFA